MWKTTKIPQNARVFEIFLATGKSFVYNGIKYY